MTPKQTLPRDLDGKAPQRARVLALGLDAPNHELLLQWMAGGQLPNLQKLQKRSAAVTIGSTKRYSNEHCWIPMLTGQNTNRWNHWLDQWDATRYKFSEASIFDWLQAPLFYARGSGLRVTSFDLTAPVVKNVEGIQIAGWASELNESYPQSEPAELLQELLTLYGPDPKLVGAKAVTNPLSDRQGVSHVVPNLYQPELMRDFALRQVRSVERRTAACRDLLKRDKWDLFITMYSEIHTAGHVLWHLSQPHPLNMTREGPEDPLLTVYQAVDRSVGQLLEEIDPTVTVVFYTIDAIVTDSLENARAIFLPEFLYRWNFPGKAALAEGVRGVAPSPARVDYAEHWKHEVWRLRSTFGDTELESPASQEAREDPMNWCPANWYAPLWSSMRAFAMPTVADGYIRLNVQGREAHGVVSAADYNTICDQLEKDLSGLVNARTGKPVVREIVRVRKSPIEDDPKQPPADLIVVFEEQGPVDTVESPLVGRIGPVPYFRSGAHQAQGGCVTNLMYVSGPGIQPGQRSNQPAALEDIPATILSLLRVALPAEFDGMARI